MIQNRLQRTFFALLFLTVSTAALAQMPPGGDRRGRGMGGNDMPRREAGPRQAMPPAPPSDPLTAFERELPSLRMDMKLEPAQVSAWDTLARAIRDAAEAQRALTKLAMGARTGEEEKPLGQWLELLDGLAQKRAASLTEARKSYTALEPALAPAQRSLLDRRFRQAQTEPLGP